MRSTSLFRGALRTGGAAAAWACLLPALAQPAAGWQACAATPDAAARLACFDAWSGRQAAPAAPAAPAPLAAPAAAPAHVAAAATSPPDEEDGCHDPDKSRLSRFWELERGSSCGTFGIRNYRPLSLSVVGSDSVNRQPTSANPANNVASAQAYRRTEMRIQLSVRSKLAQGLLTGERELRDSLWFGYTQQSYWQLFSRSISRPFRSTDHEPELMYVYPLALAAPGGWKLRYGGLGLVHQSNGQSLPLSRSWNRVYLMAGAEHAGGLALTGRVWKRLHEDAATDDNPDISDYIGRAELTASWQAQRGQRLAFTWRNSLRRLDRGSARLEWLVPFSPAGGGLFGKLNLHTQLFTGYGDSLVDYNRRRTVLSVGLSLVDW
jgi:phospholipase A1